MAEKKLPNYKDAFNAIQFPHSYEETKLPSATIPDQAISPSEMLQRHQKGLPISGKQVTFYDEDGTPEQYAMPDLNKMDLSEIAELMEANRERIRKMQEDLERSQASLNEQEQYKKYRAKFEAELAAIKSQDKDLDKGGKDEK